MNREAARHRPSGSIIRGASFALTLTAVLVGMTRMSGRRNRSPTVPAAPATIPSSRLAPHVAPSRAWVVAEWSAVSFVLVVLFWLLVRIAEAPSLFPDSGTALSISMTLAHGRISTVWDTQSPLLQDATYAALLSAGGGWMLSIPVIASSWCLAAFLGAVMARFTRVPWSAAAPPLVLLTSSAFWMQSGYLTMYAPFVLVGYAGVALCMSYQLRGGSKGLLIGGPLLLAAAPHVFTTGLIFCVVPAIACACFFSMQIVGRTLRVYAVMFVALAPWLVWHALVGGPSRIYYHPLNWFTIKYLGIVNDQFWHYERASFFGYARQMGDVALHDLVAVQLLLFVIPGLAHIAHKLGFRAAVFSLASLFFYVAVIAITRPSPFARYWFPVLPLTVLLVSAGVVAVLTGLADDVRADGSRWTPLPLRAALVLVTIIAGTLPLLGVMPSAVSQAQFRYQDRLSDSPGYADLTTMADLISETDGGVIARDSAIQAALPSNQVYTHFLLPEAAYVTFLTWPSDAIVIDMMQAQGISWVILNNDLRWERDYNVWLPVAYGVPVQHFARLPASTSFRMAYEGRVYTLYEIRPAESYTTPRSP